MTCTPQGYFEASQAIQKIAADEAGYRAAVNRAYYAVYHRCRLYYKELPQLSQLTGNGVHEQLINALSMPSKNLTSNGKERSKALGKYLRLMCIVRAKADYYPDEDFSIEKMNKAFSTAEMIFEVASVTKGPVDAPVSPLAEV